MCYLASKERSLLDPPPEFGSDIGGKWNPKQNDLLVLKRSLEKAIDEEDEEEASVNLFEGDTYNNRSNLSNVCSIPR